MTDPKTMPDLEAALIDRADRLATEYIARGRDSREAILSEERERLRNREERITEEAQADADRRYRRRVQAAQLSLQGKLDRERWNLIQAVVEELPERLKSFADNDRRYESLLKSLMNTAAENIDDDDLVASLNASDLGKLESHWPAFVKEAAPGKSIALDPQPIECSGGVKISSKDNRVCIDQTFEGRSDRFRDDLVQAIAERLLAHAEIHVG